METLALLVLILLLAIAIFLWARRTGPRKPAAEGAQASRQANNAPSLLDEDVQFTVYRPRQVQPHRWYPLLTFAHRGGPVAQDGSVVDPLAEVQRQAEAFLGEKLDEYRPVTSDGIRAIPRSGELVLVPEIEGIEFNPDRATFHWEQAVHRADFQLRATGDDVPRTARGRLTIWNGPFVIGEVPLAIQVVKHVEQVAMAAGEPGKRHRRIFASYSHNDTEVVQQFETFVESLGDRYSRDVRDLRSGQVWSEEIRDLIERADVFQLFWSWNALASKYVQEEWEYALSLKRPDFVRPVYWEEPLPSTGELPPDRLKRLHFYLLRGMLESRRNDKPPSPASPPRASASPPPPSAARPDAPLAKSYQRLSLVALLLMAGLALPLYFATQDAGDAGDSGGGRVDMSPPRMSLVFEDVLFAPEDARLSDEARRIVDEYAAALRQNTDLRLTLEGHTASTGEPEENLALGERRALAVRDYLVTQGIAPSRLRVVSYGEERPQHDTSNPETRRLNDRVALEVDPQKQP